MFVVSASGQLWNLLIVSIWGPAAATESAAHRSGWAWAATSNDRDDGVCDDEDPAHGDEYDNHDGDGVHASCADDDDGNGSDDDVGD